MKRLICLLIGHDWTGKMLCDKYCARCGFVEYRESDRDIHVINTDKQEKCEHKKTKRGIFPLVGEALQCQDCWKFIKI